MARKLIMVVEDQVDESNHFSQLLDAHGYKCHQSFNLDDALDWAQRAHFDGYIVDMHLGKSEFDGIRFIDFLASKKITAPILAISSLEDIYIHQKVLNQLLGVYDFYSKKDSKELAERIRNILEVKPNQWTRTRSPVSYLEFKSNGVKTVLYWRGKSVSVSQNGMILLDAILEAYPGPISYKDLDRSGVNGFRERVRANIANLRHQLGLENKELAGCIKNEPGIGYRWVNPNE